MWFLVWLVLMSLFVVSLLATMEFIGNLMILFRTTMEMHFGVELKPRPIEDWAMAGNGVLPVLGVGSVLCVVGLLV